MKAIALPRAGAQSALAVMDLPVPKIDDSEVLVRIKTIGVGAHDRWFMPPNLQFPYVIGIEAAGTIETMGTAVTGFGAGDRVMFVSSMQPKGGVWAEFAVVSAQSLVRMPDALDFVRAAALPVAGGTAMQSIHLLDLSPADTVFIAGASGAIGTLAIQLAKAHGCRVAASASLGNHEYLRSLGAELTVDYRDTAWVDLVRAWMPGGVNAALAIQPGTGADCMRVVKDGGRIVTVSGDQLSPERGINIAQVMGSQNSVERMTELAADVVAGRIHVEVEQVYPFERGIEALENTETRHARGKIVLALT